MSLLNPVNKSWCLEQLCESNYRKLYKLIPDLCELDMASAHAQANALSLQLNIIEQSAHTLTIVLSHSFNKKSDDMLMPAVKIRLYLDVELAEVLCDHARPNVNQVFKDFSLSREIMNYKWRLNYFLQKWLDHCLAQGGDYVKRRAVAV